MISESHRFVFVHGRKAGGQSIKAAIRPRSAIPSGPTTCTPACCRTAVGSWCGIGRRTTATRSSPTSEIPGIASFRSTGTRDWAPASTDKRSVCASWSSVCRVAGRGSQLVAPCPGVILIIDLRRRRPDLRRRAAARETGRGLRRGRRRARAPDRPRGGTREPQRSTNAPRLCAILRSVTGRPSLRGAAGRRHTRRCLLPATTTTPRRESSSGCCSRTTSIHFHYAF